MSSISNNYLKRLPLTLIFSTLYMMKEKLLGPNNKLSLNARKALLIVGIILLVLNLFTVDYEQILSQENLGAGLRILANIFIIVAMIISIRYTRREE